jgi:tetratricopeptide (TPR) repeat protein
MDRSLAEAYTSLGTVKERYDWDWKGADRDFRKAVKLNPGYAQTHQWYAVFLVMMGRFRQGDAHMEKALELDPLSVVMNWTRSYLHYYMKQYDKAVAHYNRTLEMDPSFLRARYDLALAYLLSGQKEDARKTFEEWYARRPDSPGTLPLLGYYHAVFGDTAKAQEMIRQIEALPEGRYISRFSIAIIHVALGDHEGAFRYLNQSMENHEDPLVSLKVNPRLDPLRTDPRFEDLVRRAGF